MADVDRYEGCAGEVATDEAGSLETRPVELRTAQIDIFKQDLSARGIRKAAIGEVNGLKPASAEIGSDHGAPELGWRQDLQVEIVCHVLLVDEPATAIAPDDGPPERRAHR